MVETYMAGAGLCDGNGWQKEVFMYNIRLAQTFITPFNGNFLPVGL